MGVSSLTHKGDLQKPETKFARPRQDETLWKEDDFGNKDIKSMLHGAWTEGTVFPNRIYRPNATEYALLKQEWEGRTYSSANSAIFEMEGRFNIVGEAATKKIGSREEKGTDKYTDDVIRDLNAASMTILYPEGHNNVRMVVTHPEGLTKSELELLKTSLMGKYDLQMVDGRIVHYRVKQVIPVPEHRASLQAYMLNQQGTANKNHAMPIGTRIALFDIGGYISHAALWEITANGVEPRYAVPIDYGIHHSIEAVIPLLRDGFPAIFPRHIVDMDLVIQALKTGYFSVRGKKNKEPYNAEQQVSTAYLSLYESLRAIWRLPPFNEGNSVDIVLLSGGGATLSFEYLVSTLFAEMSDVSPVEENPEMLRFGAVRGAGKGLVSFLARQQ